MLRWWRQIWFAASEIVLGLSLRWKKLAYIWNEWATGQIKVLICNTFCNTIQSVCWISLAQCTSVIIFAEKLNALQCSDNTSVWLNFCLPVSCEVPSLLNDTWQSFTDRRKNERLGLCTCEPSMLHYIALLNVKIMHFVIPHN